MKVDVILVRAGEPQPSLGTLESDKPIREAFAYAGSKIASEQITLEAWRKKVADDEPLNRMIDETPIRGDIIVTARADADFISPDRATTDAALAWIKTWPMAVHVAVRARGKA